MKPIFSSIRRRSDKMKRTKIPALILPSILCKNSYTNNFCRLNIKRQHHISTINHALKLILPQERFYFHESSKDHKSSVWRDPSNVHYMSVPLIPSLVMGTSLIGVAKAGASPTFPVLALPLNSLPANSFSNTRPLYWYILHDIFV